MQRQHEPVDPHGPPATGAAIAAPICGETRSAQPAHPPGHPSPANSRLGGDSGQPPEAAGAADAGLCDQPMPSAPQKEPSK